MEQVQTYNSAATTIKNAILNAQYEAAKGVNNIQLTLYYSIGRYISQNSRNGKWGTHAIATISQLLKEDMPGLRGYSETNLRLMRSFYEEWKIAGLYSMKLGEGRRASVCILSLLFSS